MAKQAYLKPIDAGIRAVAQQRPLEAEKAWLQALVQDPSRPEAYQLLSHLYLRIGQADRAIPLLVHLYKISPNSSHTLCTLAEAYALTGQEEKWLHTAQQAVKVEPDCPRAHALLGIAYSNIYDHKAAISELSRAALLAPNDPKIVTSLAQAQLDAADLEGAAHTALNVIAHHPSYPTAYYVLGWDFSRRPPTPINVQTALQAFQKLLQLDPSHTDVLEEMGRLYLLTGSNQKARKYLESAWKKGDHSQEVAYNLAQPIAHWGTPNALQSYLLSFRNKPNMNCNIMHYANV